MEIGETIAEIAVVRLGNEPCWFCEAEPGPQLTNEEDADPDTDDEEDEDAVPENDMHNDASRLGVNLTDQPTWSIDCPSVKGKRAAVQSAAHHCIPGNASLKQATTLLKFMRKEGPWNFSSDIGYNVNDSNNGVWLPGNYGVRPGNGHYTRTWGAFDEDFKDQYAMRAMRAAHLQFHDAHQNYSLNVRRTLEDIASKLGRPRTTCPVCGESLARTLNGVRPPFGLVGRLHGVSAAHRYLITTLDADTGKPFVEAGYFTSSRVKKLFDL
jgi:hypothetical protein